MLGFHEDELVPFFADLASKPSWQTILELKTSRTLVFSLMEGGQLQTVVGDTCPNLRAYTPVAGHVCGTNQAKDYHFPTIIGKQRAAALHLLNDDVTPGSCLGFGFDEATNCCVHILLNIIVSVFAFGGRRKAINCLAVTEAILEAWEQLGLPQEPVGVVLVHNACYSVTRFKVHLASCFRNAQWRTSRLIRLIGLVLPP